MNIRKHLQALADLAACTEEDGPYRVTEKGQRGLAVLAALTETLCIIAQPGQAKLHLSDASPLSPLCGARLVAGKAKRWVVLPAGRGNCMRCADIVMDEGMQRAEQSEKPLAEGGRPRD